MGIEINLLQKYPRTIRDISKRCEEKSERIRTIAQRFGKEFFDGDRKYGYGGYYYNPKFWTEVVKDLKEHYTLTDSSKVLDIGCGKGFMLFDLKKLIPGIEVKGLDISKYAIDNSMDSIKQNLYVGNAMNLPFDENEFDLVVSINTIHNLENSDCRTALKEISRVSKGNSFVTVDAYGDDEEKKLMDAWNLTAKTYFSTDGWTEFFKSVGYTGDYYWFKP